MESLKPFSGSNFSTPLIRPRFPSCTKSRKLIPRPVYLLAIETTKRRLASINLCLAYSSPSCFFMARAYSSSAVRRGTVPISFRYILTGSSVPIPSRRSTASRSISSPSSSFTKSSSSSKGSRASASALSPSFSMVLSASSSRMGLISIPLFSSKSKTCSICSSFRENSFTASCTSPKSMLFLLLFAFCSKEASIFSNSSLSK